MRVSRKELVKDEVMKNLLSAHERIADCGTTTEIIRLSKYLLKLANKRNDVLVDIAAEENQERRNDPV